MIQHITLLKFQILFFPLQCATLSTTNITTEHLSTINKTTEHMSTVNNTSERLTTINKTREHLKFQRIKDLCTKKDYICENNTIQYLCGIRVENGKMVKQDFENYCIFFLVNMCDFPGQEWAIKDGGTCQQVNARRFMEQYENQTQRGESDHAIDISKESNLSLKGAAYTTKQSKDVTSGDFLRRFEEQVENVTHDVSNVTDVTDAPEPEATELNDTETDVTDPDTTDTDVTETDVTDTDATVTEETTTTYFEYGYTEGTRNILRTWRKITYAIEHSDDGHPCPQYCADIYSPVCVNINRPIGQFYKLLWFVNHCEADKHYCLHFNTEYTQPPDFPIELSAIPSNLAWSACAANKYMDFATFAESASSLAHYGWLYGNKRPEHIMEPWERVPGFG